MSPLGKRQRRTPSKWYCEPDDEFLSHDRRSGIARLEISSSSSSTGYGCVDGGPAWHHWFKRKPRTLRQRRGCSGNGQIVPDFCTPLLSSEEVPEPEFKAEPALVPKMSTDVEGDIELEEVVEDLFFMEGLMEQGRGVKLDYGSPWTGGDVKDAGSNNKRAIMLNLNYSQVMNAWSTQGSPWTDGERPANIDLDLDLDLDGFEYQQCADYSGRSAVTTTTVAVSGDGIREARVSRYKEKRRRRLFSKKIRYQVRKLNAEKRPRMKGRFVKRTPSFTASNTPV